MDFLFLVRSNNVCFSQRLPSSISSGVPLMWLRSLSMPDLEFWCSKAEGGA